MSEKYYSISPYAYCAGDPVNLVDPDGRDTIVVHDQSTRPLDNGTPGTSYTADVAVIQNGSLTGVYNGSSYPDSKSNTDNSTEYNTVAEGTPIHFNNKSGHKLGTKRGLNLVDDSGARNCPGYGPSGDDTTVMNANVHTGFSNNGNATSRGSHACITINPSDSAVFFDNFSWKNDSATTGTSEGTLFIIRNKDVYNSLQGTTSKHQTLGNGTLLFYLSLIQFAR